MAQSTTGSLTGAVKGANGAPLADAKVILTSPALFAPRVVMTDTKGEWRAQLLPVGAYRVQALKDGFIGAEAQNLRVGIGTALHQELVLKPVAQASAVVEVVGNNADLDKADTKASTNFSAETLEALAAADRGFVGATDLAPGVASSSNGGFSVRGGATQNTLYRVNGTDIKDDLQGAQVGTWVIQDNIADVQVVLSPLNARNGRALGGQVNVVTKTGGNEFEGSFRANLSRPTWGSENPYTKPLPHWVNDDLSRTLDITFSGPIVKDRVWFSLGTILTPSQSGSYETGPSTRLAQGPMRTGLPSIDTFVATGPSGYSFASSLADTKPYSSTYTSNYIEGKITGAINENHTMDLSYTVSDNRITNRNPGVPIRRTEALGTQTGKQQAWGINYRAVLGADKFLETRYNRYLSEAVFPTGDPRFSSDAVDIWFDAISPNPHNFYQIGYPFGLGITPRPDKRNNTSANVNLGVVKDFWGIHHEMDLGMEYYQADRNTTQQAGEDNRYFRAGGAFYNQATQDWLFPAIIWPGYGIAGQSATGNTGLAPVMWQYMGRDGITKNTTASVYANDSMTIGKHWSLMLGLRFDTIGVTDTDGRSLAKASDISPRFQLRFDPKGDGRHVFTFTAARFQGDFTSGFTSSFVTTATSKQVNYGFAGLPGQPNVWQDQSSSAVRWLTYAQLTNPANYTHPITDVGYGTSTAYAFYDNSKSYIVDPNLKSPYMDEMTLTYRRAFEGGNFARFTYVHRQWKKEWAFASDYALDQMVTISDPSGSGLPDKLANTVHIFNSDKLTRRYQGFEVEVYRKFTPSFSMSGNYTYGRLTGNNNGGDSPLSTFRDNSIPGYYNNRRYLTQEMGLTDAQIAPDGPLTNDQTHRVRLSFTLERPLDKGRITYSALARYDSGSNWSANYSRPLGQNGYDQYGNPGPMQNIPNAPAAPASFTYYYGGRGQYTFNDTYQVDLKVSYRIPLGYKMFQLMGDIQVSNLFNQILKVGYSTSRAPLPYGSNYLFLNTTPYGTFGGANAQEGNYWTSGRSFATSIGLRF
ncbi:MAG TPA: TonB-dependent receptor [Holophagaceae bacterium]|nr:TonB-dependent receptor [Holophagaceae bacterium]